MIPEKMKAVVVTAPGKAEVLELSTPKAVAGQNLARLELGLICTWEQRVFAGTGSELPFLPGHEISGVVAEIPEGTYCDV